MTSIKNSIFNDFGKYISQAEKTKFNDIDNRFLILSQKDTATFLEDFYPESAINRKNYTGGKFLRIGDFIAVSDMKELAKSFWEENKKHYSDDEKIDPTAIIMNIQLSLLASTLVHECIHSTEGKSVEYGATDSIHAIALSECGTSYITEQVLKNHYPRARIFRDKIDEHRVEVFDNILKKHGEKAYIVFFNNKPGNMDESTFKEIKKSIYAVFNSENLLSTGILSEEQIPEYERWITAGP